MAKQKPFKASVSAETQFARALRKVARHAGHIVEAHVHGHKIHGSAEMQAALKAYSKLIDPWARRQAAKMLAQVSKKNKTSWTKNSIKMGKLLRETVAQESVGQKAAELLHEQVGLITSIPTRAGERAQKLAAEAFYNGSRASEISEELQRSGKVSESDADRIARTEVARANSVITQVRAQAAGSRQYVWRNSGDESVREAHKFLDGKKLDGQVFSWDKPPTLDDGATGHPGTFPNCRCYPEPFFPENVHAS